MIVWTSKTGEHSFTRVSKNVHDEHSHALTLQHLMDDATFTIIDDVSDEVLMELYPNYGKERKKNTVLRNILDLEAKVTARLVREATLGSKEAINKLTEINDAITALRVKL